MSTPVLHMAHYETQGHHVTQIACAQGHVGRIIGRHGITVRGIQLYAKVTIGIDQSRDPADVVIVGSSLADVVLGTSIVLDVLLSNFKGFALLREIVDAQRKTGEISAIQVFYRPGLGLFPVPCSLKGDVCQSHAYIAAFRASTRSGRK